jgi:hypothetical protein
MKTLSKLGLLADFGPSLFLSSCAGEYYVASQPADVVYEPGPPPYVGGVWVGEDWVWAGGRYVHQRGHWERGRAGRAYVRGGWYHGPRGYAWHRGHWQR